MPSLDFDSLLEINATSPNGDHAAGSVIRLESTGAAVTFHLLGAKIQLSPDDVLERDGAIVVTAGKKVDCSPFEWMQFGQSQLALMLAANVKPQDNRNPALCRLVVAGARAKYARDTVRSC